MVKKIIGGVLLGTMSLLAQAGETLEEALKESKWSGQLRSFYINRDWSGSVGDGITDRDALAAGGHLRGETGKWHGVSFGVGFYSSNGLGVNDDNPAAVDGTLFDDDKNSYSILGEAYVKFSGESSSFTAGRQKLTTPFLGTDDARMLPTLFMAYTYENTGFENTTLTLSHVNKMAAGSFSNAYPQIGLNGGDITAGGALSLASGYGLNNESARFMNIGNYTSGINNNGLFLGGVKHKFSDTLSLQIWDYYATDLFNTIYAQADFKFATQGLAKPFFSAQLINQSGVGDEDLGRVDGNYFAIKAGVGFKNISGYIAYSDSGSNNSAATNGGILAPWAGMPAFTQAMATRHQFFADTDAFKIGGRYNFNALGVNLTFDLYHASFDIGSDNAYVNGTDFTAKESGFDLIFKPKNINNLTLRFRGNFPSDFRPGLDWAEYRFILNYNF
ncbi:MAG: OprD family outer membrane porin [Alcanivoracaceae bacterium]|nr:OprD family outer membrane porin [Alcanivoracaceae bacterium]